MASWAIRLRANYQSETACFDLSLWAQKEIFSHTRLMIDVAALKLPVGPEIFCQKRHSDLGVDAGQNGVTCSAH